MKLFLSINASAVMSIVLFASPGHAEVVFSDNFDTSLTSGVNTDVNFEIGGGRLTGTTPITYTEQTLTGAGGFINNNAAFTGDNLLLRNNYNSSGPRASGAIVATNLGSSLEGKKYSITYEGNFSVTGGAATDRWGAVYLMGALPGGGINGATVNAGATDIGILYRDFNGRATVWDDGAIDTNFTADNTTGVTTGTVYTFEMLVDETLATPEATIWFNRGTGSEVEIGTFEFDFEAGDAGNRYLGLRANIGTAGGTTNGALFDTRIDNLTVTVIPEPSSLALLAVASVGAMAGRRRRRTA